MLSCQKVRFFLPDEVRYLNCAYMSPIAKAVEQAGLAGMRQKRNPSATGPADFFADSDRVRDLFGRLIGAPARSIAIIPSVSYGIATIANNLEIAGGSNIVLLEEQFPSNVYIWRRIARERGAHIRTVGADVASGNRSAAWNARILESIDGQTAVVALPHVQWTDGTLFDLEAISDRARTVGAALVVDGTQSVGALPFDVGRIRPDALVCAGYKWLLGPYSIGVAYFDPRHHEGVPLEENWITRRHSEEFSRLVAYEDDYQPGAVRYDVGERSNFILVPMMAAALELVLEWGAENIQEYSRHLTQELLERAQEMGYRIEGEDGRAAHLFGIRMPEAVEAERLRTELDHRNVSVSIRGSAVRVSPHVYNDEQDVAVLLDALDTAARVAT